jgi:hypothetical protein
MSGLSIEQEIATVRNSCSTKHMPVKRLRRTSYIRGSSGQITCRMNYFFPSESDRKLNRGLGEHT